MYDGETVGVDESAVAVRHRDDVERRRTEIPVTQQTDDELAIVVDKIYEDRSRRDTATAGAEINIAFEEYLTTSSFAMPSSYSSMCSISVINLAIDS
jgi:hypothetical protein